MTEPTPLSLEELVKLLAPRVAQRLLSEPRFYGAPERIHVAGEVCHLSNALFNTVSGEIWVGEEVFFGHDVMVLTGTHDPALLRQARIQGYPATGYDIRIGRGVWVSSGALILGPCTIGDDAVIAAGAVVTGNVPARAIVAGVPARFIRNIDEMRA